MGKVSKATEGERFSESMAVGKVNLRLRKDWRREEVKAKQCEAGM